MKSFFAKPVQLKLANQKTRQVLFRKICTQLFGETLTFNSNEAISEAEKTAL